MKCTCKLSRGNQLVGLPNDLKPRCFSGFAKSELDAFLSAARHRQFRTSSVILNQEDRSERCFLLTSGHARQFVITDRGQKVLLNWLSPGQIFGGAALVSTPWKYPASTEALSDCCTVVWDRQPLRELAAAYPALLDNAFSIAVTENIAWLIAACVSLSSDDAPGRVAHLLLSLASAIGQPTPDGIQVKVMNKDLAEGANVTQFTVSRCLKRWQRAGILAKRRGMILLRKPELLLASRASSEPLLRLTA
jgi:CRP-like cAMP-binding protein